MKKTKLTRLLYSALACVTFIVAQTSQATPIARSDFASNAINFNFSGSSFGDTSATDGFLTVSNGVVLDIPNLINTSFYDGGDASVIRMDFLNPISALGLDFFVNFADTSLGLFDANNNLLTSLMLSATDAMRCRVPTTNITGLCGYLGLDFGTNSVAYALIDTPLKGNELLIDNLIYQRTEVSEPATFALMGLGLLGLVWLRRKKDISSNSGIETA